MKIWLKYLIAIAVGVTAGLVIPFGDGVVLDAVAGATLNVGRYVLLPLSFASMAVAAFELHDEKRLWIVWLKTAGFAIATVVALSLVGLAGAYALSPGRIPLSADAAPAIGSVPTPLGVLSAMLAPDALGTLSSFEFLLPSSLFAMILGIGLAFDKAASKPVAALLDSASRILWQINGFFVELLPLPLIAAAAARTVAIGRIPRLEVFGPLFAAIGAETAFVVLALLPATLWLIDRATNPFKTLFAMLAPALAAVVAGHGYLQAGVAAKHLKESLGVRRRAGAVSLPVALAFGRAGTAMVTTTAFVAILNSYSNLGLGSGAVLWMLASAPIASLLLGAAPGLGPIVALTSLCASYGRGFESGYILLVPAALPLALAAAFVDSVCANCVIYAVASSEGQVQPKDVRHFI